MGVLPRRIRAARVARVMQADTLTQSVLFLLAMTVFQRGIGFFRGVLFCSWLDPEELGQWDLTYGFLMLAAPVAVLGLTGTFGRYLEYYRTRGQTRPFLRHTSLWIALLALAAATWMYLAPAWFSRLIFGSDGQQHLVGWISLTLLVLIAFNYASELFGGLRIFRLVSIMQFVQSALFFGLGTLLILAWQPTAQSVVMAFMFSTCVCVVLATWWVAPAVATLPATTSPMGSVDLGRKLLPFAANVWITNWLANLFEVADRYMIVHHSGMPADVALAQVGNYHAARVMPVVMIAVAALLRSAVLPHLSHDWEQGRRSDVSRQLSLTVRMLGLALLAGSVVLLFVAPWIFHYGFRGKFDGGLAVMPLTMTYLSWVGLMVVASSYLWVAERALLGSLSMALGLAVNIGLNLILLPRYGLYGAVLATAIANAVTLGTTLWFNRLADMRIDVGTVIVAASPACLAFGPWVSLGVLLVLTHQALTRNWLLSAAERQMCLGLAHKALAKVRRRTASVGDA